MSKNKQVWLLAGGNGAGKSTFYQRFLKDLGISFINADLIAKQISPNNPEQMSYQAASIAAKFRSALLEKGASFCFETVFSHPSKIDFAAEAKAMGYEVILVYIHLHTSELNLARVAQRVSEGGHNVPDEKVLARIPRTMENIRTVLPIISRAQLYDNSSQDYPFLNIAHMAGGQLTLNSNPLPQWAEKILTDYL